MYMFKCSNVCPGLGPFASVWFVSRAFALFGRKREGKSITETPKEALLFCQFFFFPLLIQLACKFNDLLSSFYTGFQLLGKLSFCSIYSMLILTANWQSLNVIIFQGVFWMKGRFFLEEIYNRKKCLRMA